MDRKEDSGARCDRIASISRGVRIHSSVIPVADPRLPIAGRLLAQWHGHVLAYLSEIESRNAIVRIRLLARRSLVVGNIRAANGFARFPIHVRARMSEKKKKSP